MLKLPKNFALMKLIEQTASRSALVELGAPPCSQCDPSQPRRAASTFCEDCRSYLCTEHEQQLHAVAALQRHQRVSLAQKAQQQQAAAQQDQFLAQAAAPVKDELLSRSKQLTDLDAETQQLIRSLPQSQSSFAVAMRTEVHLAVSDRAPDDAFCSVSLPKLPQSTKRATTAKLQRWPSCARLQTSWSADSNSRGR